MLITQSKAAIDGYMATERIRWDVTEADAPRLKHLRVRVLVAKRPVIVDDDIIGVLASELSRLEDLEQDVVALFVCTAAAADEVG